jgi:hypothetical protein
VTPELVTALQKFVESTGGPMFITIAVLLLMWKMLGLMGKQNDILTTLNANTASTHEMVEDSGVKLDTIIGKLERGVCREVYPEVDQAVHRDADHQRDRRAGRTGLADV